MCNFEQTPNTAWCKLTRWPKELYGPPPFVVLFLRSEGAMRPRSIAPLVAQSRKGCAISSKTRATYRQSNRVSRILQSAWTNVENQVLNGRFQSGGSSRISSKAPSGIEPVARRTLRFSRARNVRLLGHRNCQSRNAFSSIFHKARWSTIAALPIAMVKIAPAVMAPCGGLSNPERGLKFAASTTRENDRPGRASESGLDIPAHLQGDSVRFRHALNGSLIGFEPSNCEHHAILRKAHHSL